MKPEDYDDHTGQYDAEVSPVGHMIMELYDRPVRQAAHSLVDSFLMRDVWGEEERAEMHALIDALPLRDVVDFLDPSGRS